MTNTKLTVEDFKYAFMSWSSSVENIKTAEDVIEMIEKFTLVLEMINDLHDQNEGQQLFETEIYSKLSETCDIIINLLPQNNTERKTNSEN